MGIRSRTQALAKRAQQELGLSVPGAAAGMDPHTASMDEIDAFLSADQAAAAVPGATAESTPVQAGAPSEVQTFLKQAGPTDLDPDKFLADTTLDTTGDVVPAWANGQNPETAIGKSPLSLTDRALFSLTGNKKGIESKLREKFEDVAQDPSNPNSFVVKDNGVWKKVDPENDAWETTKNLTKMGFRATVPGLAGPLLGAASDSEQETFGDLADISKELGIAGASIAAAIATGGTSLLAQSAAQVGVAGGLAAMETSMGRAIGTYEATPEEQLQDIGTEMLYATAGEVAGAGVRLTAAAAKPLFQKLAAKTGAAASFTNGLLKDALSGLWGVDEKYITRAFDPSGAKRVGRIVDQVAQGGISASEASYRLAEKQINITEKVMTQMDNGINDLWKTGMDDVAKMLPKSGFKLKPAEVFADAYKAGLDDGILRLERPVVKMAGDKVVGKSLKTLTGAEALAAIEANKGQLPRGWRVAVQSREAAMRTAAQAGKSVPLHADPRNYKEVAGLFKNTVMLGNELPELAGKEGFEKASNLLSQLKRSTYSLKNRAGREGLVEASNYSARLASAYDTGFEGVLSRMGADDSLKAFQSTKKNFSQALTKTQELQPLWESFKKTKNRNELAELTDILLDSANPQAREGATFITKELFGAKNSASQKRMGMLYDYLFDHETARQFLPLASEGRAKVATTAAIGSGVAGNTKASQGFWASALASSRRVGLGAIRRYDDARSAYRGVLQNYYASKGLQDPKMLQKTVQTGLKGVNFLRNLGPRGAKAIADNPEAFTAFIQTLSRTPGDMAAEEQQLLNDNIVMPGGGLE